MARQARHKVILSGPERARLEQLAASGEGHVRARALLASASGESDTAIAARLRCSAQTVAAWRARFAADRLDGLADRPRTGRPRVRTESGADNAVVYALTRLAPDGELWTKATMAAETGLSVRSVATTWTAAGIAPHRQDLSRPGVDPLWHGAARAIAGLHLDPSLRLLACWRTPTPPRRVTADTPLTGWNDVNDDVMGLLTAAHARTVATTPEQAQAPDDLRAHRRRFLLALSAARPAEAVLHLVADRALENWIGVEEQEILRRFDVQLHMCPGARSWGELVRRALATTLWEQQLRAGSGPGDACADWPVRWRNELLAAAHHPDAPVVHQFSRPRQDTTADLELMTRPRPRTRAQVDQAVPDPQGAWRELVARWADDSRHVLPDQPYLALAHLRTHADELALTGQDAVCALVLLTAHRRRLDLVELLLHKVAGQTLIWRRDIAASLGVSVGWLDDHKKALRRVAASAGGTLSLTTSGPSVPEADPVATEGTAPAETMLETITRMGARSLAAWLVEHWERHYDELDDPDHTLPDPSDYLAVAEHACLHHYRIVRDEREHEILAALRVTAHLRGRVAGEQRFWQAFARQHDVPHKIQGAATGRSAAASAVSHRRLTKPAESPAPHTSLAPVAEREPYWHAYSDRMSAVLRNLLSAKHRAVLRRDRDVRDSLDELDEALEATGGVFSTTVVAWLLVLISEIATSDLIQGQQRERADETEKEAEQRLRLAAEIEKATQLRREMQAARGSEG